MWVCPHKKILLKFVQTLHEVLRRDSHMKAWGCLSQVSLSVFKMIKQLYFYPQRYCLRVVREKKRQKRKPKRRKKKVINDKFFNTSRLFLFLLLLKGRCQINHISIGPLQRINSNFLKSILAAFTWVSPAPLILECAIFTTTQLFQNKNNVTNHDDGKVINHTKNVAVNLFFSPSLRLD